MKTLLIKMLNKLAQTIHDCDEVIKRPERLSCIDTAVIRTHF